MKDILLIILYAIPCFIVSSSIHELGHVIVGLIEGFRFYLFIAGPFGIKRNEKGKIAFYIEKNVSLWGGLSATMPESEDVNNFKKFGHVLLGGPAASMIFGAICFIFGIITKSIFLILPGAMSIGMGAACIIPARNGAFYTDGGRWLRMHKNESTRAVETAIWNIVQNVIIQGSCVKINFDEINILINDDDMRTKYMGHYYAYQYYKDNNDTVSAEKEKVEIENLKTKVPKQMATIYHVD